MSDATRHEAHEATAATTTACQMQVYPQARSEYTEISQSLGVGMKIENQALLLEAISGWSH